MNPELPVPWIASEAEGGSRKHAPATYRNRDAIVSVLQDLLPEKGLILELASGSGEHVVHFASQFPGLSWQPTDCDPDSLASIEAWRIHAGLENIRPPLQLDAAESDWPLREADAVLCINMIHITPWHATEGAISGARRMLKAGQPLLFYGPFKQAGTVIAPRNAAFDTSLRERNPEWGLRDVEDVIALARQQGFGRHRIVSMPTNNLSIIFYASQS
jgi:hypothetical protein